MPTLCVVNFCIINLSMQLCQGHFYIASDAKQIWFCHADFVVVCLQLYIAPITHADRYSESIDFWHNVYGIDSEYTPYLLTC